MYILLRFCKNKVFLVFRFASQNTKLQMPDISLQMPGERSVGGHLGWHWLSHLVATPSSRFYFKEGCDSWQYQYLCEGTCNLSFKSFHKILTPLLPLHAPLALFSSTISPSTDPKPLSSVFSPFLPPGIYSSRTNL